MRKGCVALTLMMMALPVQAGTLDDFEKKATNNKSTNSKGSSSKKEDTGSLLFDLLFGDDEDSNKKSGSNKKLESNAKDNNNDGLFDVFAALAVDMIVGGGQSSFIKAQNFGADKPATGPFFSVSPKLSGDRLVPFARFDAYGSEISSNVYLKDYTLELGYGAFALYGKESHFIESDPSDELKFKQWFIDYRMLLTDQFQFSIGTGKYQIRGNNKTTQDAAKLGLAMHLFNGLYFDYSYVKSKGSQFSLTDQEGSFTYAYKNIGFKAGYRQIVTTGAKLTGPFAGFTLQF